MKLEQHYPAEVFFSEEDEGFIAIAPDLPGCSAFGETQAEALIELQSAIEAWISAASKAGNLVPEPSLRSSPNLPSGKVLLRLPKTLHARLNQKARTESVSLNTCLIMLLSEMIGSREETSKASSITTTYVGQTATISNPTGVVGLLRHWSAHHHAHESLRVVSREGSVANLERLPAGQPVIIVED